MITNTQTGTTTLSDTGPRQMFPLVREAIALARTRPCTLACTHGSAWRGDGSALLLALAESLATSR